MASKTLLSSFQPLKTHPTVWTPEEAKVTLNITLDACIVPVESGGARVDFASLVVLDDFFGEIERSSLLDFLTEPGWDHEQGPPLQQWEKATADAAFMPRTWGLKDEALKRFSDSMLPAKLEIQSRLCKLYPQFNIIHMPSSSIQSPSKTRDPNFRGSQLPSPLEISTSTGGGTADDRAAAPAYHSTGSTVATAVSHPCGNTEGCGDDEDDEVSGAQVDCNAFVANAAVHGDAYSWHVDADPSVIPESPWTGLYGRYFNREPNKPLFVSMLLYLNESWSRELDAETLFLDTATDTGILVRPKKYRVVLMDQDVIHRLSAPSRLSSGRPRYSLVWKLVFLPHAGVGPQTSTSGSNHSLSRPEWGFPTAFGSAAKMQAAAKQLSVQAKRARSEASRDSEQDRAS